MIVMHKFLMELTVKAETDLCCITISLPILSVKQDMVGSPKRREIGHGRLAKRALMAVLPDNERISLCISYSI